MLQGEELGKRFGDRWVFRHVTFDLAAGQVLAVVGPNGCGKSTLLGIVAGLVQPTEGVARLSCPFGFASLAGELYSDLTVAEHLELTADLRCCEARIAELLDVVGLTGATSYPAHTLSSGMRARLKLAIAVQERPPLLILDEPGAGLDRQGCAVLTDVIRAQCGHGAVLLATNDPEEMKLATHELDLT
ncbi:MAG: ABC transporter ATP-binding protein [Fimbriimonadaceae bacterium]